MVRNFLVLLVFLGVGFGASVAQSDIFVRQSPKKEATDGADAPKKRSIFLRPFMRNRDKKTAPKIRYNGNLDTSGLSNRVAQDLKTLAYWQQRKVKPQNALEMASYAVALRSNNKALMLKHRQKVLPKLQAIQSKRVRDFEARLPVRSDDNSFANAIDAMQLAQLTGKVMPVRARPAVAAKAVLEPSTVVPTSSTVNAVQRPTTSQAGRPSVPIYVRPKAKADQGQADTSQKRIRVITDY